VLSLIEAGATDIGENYVQEAEELHKQLGDRAKKIRWHMIGHMQKNKLTKALKIFNVIQTVDSLEIAKELDKKVSLLGKDVIPVYIEVNIGNETKKSGIKPEYHIIEELAKEISKLPHLRLEGLMTMGPSFGNAGEIRPYFKKIKDIFEKIKALPNVSMKTLSMGMSGSYKVAIEEGSNMVRLGTVLFGDRL